MEDPAATAAAIRRWRSSAGCIGIEKARSWLRKELSIDLYVTRTKAIHAAAVITARLG
jgi:hypothetical protein